MHFLYKITNVLNNKIYIGQTNNPKLRWWHHKWQTKKGCPYYIHRAMRKYGIDSFHFQVIACCKTQDDANVVEMELIKQYNSNNPSIGYNMDEGGGGRSGFHFNDKSKTQMRLRQYQAAMARIENGESVGVSLSNKNKYKNSNPAKPWSAMIRVAGSRDKTYLGSFATKEEAQQAYKQKLQSLIERIIDASNSSF